MRSTSSRLSVWVLLILLATQLQAQPTTAPIGRPIRVTLLFVHAASCEACASIDRTLAQMAAEGGLRDVDVRRIDADADRAVVAAMEVTTTPTLRVLDAAGQLIASRSGPMDRLAIEALLSNAAQADAPMPDSADACFAAIASPHPLARSRAIDWLSAHPDSARRVVDAFASASSLQTRLALLEVLDRWNAPTDGLDPWQPSTVTDARVTKLRAWAEKPTTQPAP